MQLTPRQAILQFGQVLQQQLFPHLEASVGRLSPELELLAAVVSLVPLGNFLAAGRARTGRPAKDRAALATAFIAKAILNLPTTRDLLDRLRVDQALRQFCGWRSPRSLPHESKFSRAFAEFAAGQLPQQLHQAVIQATQHQRLIGHIARDSTAIPARERVPEPVMENKRAAKKQFQARKNKPRQRKHPKGCFAKAKASERGKRIQQPHQTLDSAVLFDPADAASPQSAAPGRNARGIGVARVLRERHATGTAAAQSR